MKQNVSGPWYVHWIITVDQKLSAPDVQVTTLLDLRQREATLEDALSMGEQSTMLFVFTAVTVLFVSPTQLHFMFYNVPKS